MVVQQQVVADMLTSTLMTKNSNINELYNNRPSQCSAQLLIHLQVLALGPELNITLCETLQDARCLTESVLFPFDVPLTPHPLEV